MRIVGQGLISIEQGYQNKLQPKPVLLKQRRIPVNQNTPQERHGNRSGAYNIAQETKFHEAQELSHFRISEVDPVIDKKPKNIKESGEPSHHGDDVQSLYHKISVHKVSLPMACTRQRPRTVST